MYRRILIAQTAFLGDTVLSTPLMRACRERWPGAELAVMVRTPAAPLLRGLPFLDEVLIDHPPGRPKTDGWRHTLRLLREREFDLAITPSRSVRVGMLLAAAGIPRRVGYRLDMNPLFYTDLVERRQECHAVERERLLLAPLGGPAPRYPLAVTRSTTLPEAVDALLVGPAARRVALSPGSVWATKRWLAEGFAEVANRLAARGTQVVLVGSPLEREIAANVARAAPHTVNLCGATSLPELAEVLARSSLLICNDSAPAHIAGAVGTPVVQIYGATTPALGFAPLDPRSRVVDVPLTCRPCGKHGAASCPQGHFRCMRDIRSDNVLAAVGEVLTGLPMASVA